MVDNKTALILLNLIPGITPRRFKALLEAFPTASDVFRSSIREISRLKGFTQSLAERILGFDQGVAEREKAQCRRLGIKIVVLHDTEYPEALRFIFDPPPVLYIKGDLRPDDRLAISVVGSRQATRLGCSQAYHLSHDLAKEGFTVVSGMASGIDTFSHRGAIAADGRTIAVFGSGLDQVYPSHNLKLAEEISRRGALISEFPLGTRPMRYNFPRRNRIISGLSLGVIVVEAALRSGALITATFALEQGRDVFALPGGVGGKNSAGVNKLIKEGAKLVEGVSDVLEEYEHILGTREKTDRRPHLGELGRVEMDILELLKGGPRPVDELIGDSNISSHEVLSSLTQLELKGAIQRLPGRMFSRIT